MNVIKVLVTLIVIGFISSGTVFAGKTAIPPAKDIRAVIQETLKYPATAIKDSFEGDVEIIFTVNEEGKIQVEKVGTKDTTMATAIKEQLAQVCCKDILGTYNQHFKVVISFKLV